MVDKLKKPDKTLEEELDDISFDDDELDQDTKTIETAEKVVGNKSEQATLLLDDNVVDQSQKTVKGLSEKSERKYVFQRSIGHGGMKTILQVKDKDTARDVAMAVMLHSENEEKNQEKLGRFIKEAKITANLEHPNIVPVHEIGVDQTGSPYFTMKLVKGETLAAILAKLDQGDAKYIKRYTLTNLLLIFRKVCNAIAFAHSKGIVHLDLTPENIQVGRFGEVLLLDWGLAKSVGQPESEIKDAASQAEDSQGKPPNVTMDGVVKGTPGYMAPEQAAGRNSEKNFQTDIYALGAILYSILTYKSPIEGKEISEMLNDTIYGNIIPPKQRVKEMIPSALDAVAMKAMHVDPQERYQRVLELREDIDSFISGFATTAERAGVVKKNFLLLKRHKLASSFAAIALVLLVIFVHYALKEHSMLQADWIPVYRESFIEGAADLSEIGFRDRFIKRKTRPWQVTVNGLKFERMGWAWLETLKLKGNVKVAMSVLFTEEPKAFEVCVNSRIEPLKKWWAIPKGCAFQIGRYGGTKNVICTNYDNRKTEVLASMEKRLIKGKIYKLVFMRQEEVLSISIDGKEVARVVDLFLPFDSRLDKIGIRSFGGEMYLRNISVFRLALPAKASPLIAGDALAEAQHYQDAISKYLTIAENYNGSPVAEKALLKAYVTAATKLKNSAKFDAFRRIKTKIAFEFPGFNFNDKLLEIDALTFWRDKQYRDALKLIPRIFELNPGSRIMVNLLQEEHLELPEDIGHLMMEWVAKTRDLDELNLSELGLKEIVPLQQVALVFLDCSKNSISDISSLEGMPLEELNISYNDISDLTPLKNSRIESLNCGYNPIVSLDSLSNLPLKSLCLIGCDKLRSVRPLLNIETLEEVRLPEGIGDVGLLRRHDGLKKITIGSGELLPVDLFWQNWRREQE